MSMHTPERIIGETFTDVGLDELDTLPMPKGMLVVKRFRGEAKRAGRIHSYSL